jgi:hypothetical protein
MSSRVGRHIVTVLSVHAQGISLSDVTWVLVMGASVASGALGALVTAYGTQARERRPARAKVYACFQRVEELSRQPDPSQGYYRQLLSVLEDLETASLIAAIPY